MTNAEDFRKIAIRLTGVDSIPHAISESYLERLKNADGYPPVLSSVFELYKKHGDGFVALLGAEQRKCCRGVVFLFYTAELIPLDKANESELPPQRTSGSQKEYYSGLIWPVIRAHPPGLSGGYFGHWKYEPEN